MRGQLLELTGQDGRYLGRAIRQDDTGGFWQRWALRAWAGADPNPGRRERDDLDRYTDAGEAATIQQAIERLTDLRST